MIISISRICCEEYTDKTNKSTVESESEYLWNVLSQ